MVASAHFTVVKAVYYVDYPTVGCYYLDFTRQRTWGNGILQLMAADYGRITVSELPAAYRAHAGKLRPILEALSVLYTDYHGMKDDDYIIANLDESFIAVYGNVSLF